MAHPSTASKSQIPEERPVDQVMVDLRAVDKYYKSAAGDFHALKGVDLQINAGEFVSIIGKSGSGKSTLLNMMTGIDRPTTGEVWVNGTPVHRLSENKMAIWRGGNLGILFQFFQLLPSLTLLQNVVLPMDLVGKYPVRQRRQRAEALLETVGLAEHRHKLPSMISGGQQQRAALARALANDPPLIVADEPTGNLDSKTAEAVFTLLKAQSTSGKTVIIVTHDTGLARRSNRTALIADGELVNEYLARALPTLTFDQMLAATHELKRRRYEAGAMIITEGRNSDAFYIVAKGTVEVVLPRQNQSEVVALELGTGRYFGEMEFFHDRRNRASIRACSSSAVEVLELTYEQLNRLLGQSEATRDALQKAADAHEQEHKERETGA
jgi:ABC-type lipoprotein export system ATPase subunit